ncbi:hypothetical protein IWQ60_005800 [Tieghemiomyces parasiticus]|uniref:P-type ATPase A domain-containing protein n=1 Tax=Tieghemiomyces parasiticus TaxID=78921 RepID=A0A9W8A8H1_9FUNG|nr:hypothetical protein IWQ60_005800 [Tieghemiomyces parasiticus]
MQLQSFSVLLAACVLGSVVAIPRFNDVNGEDAYGNQCPLLERNNVKCPSLCVVDPSLCPASVAPRCDAGLNFCLDGTCQEDCEGIANVCMCDLDTAQAGSTLYPCAVVAPVSIPAYDPHNKDALVADYCGRTLNGNGNATADAIIPYGYPPLSADQDHVWLQCPTPPEPTLSFTEPKFVIFYSLLGAQLGLLALWALVRSSQIKIFTQHPLCTDLVTPAFLRFQLVATRTSARNDHVLATEGKHAAVPDSPDADRDTFSDLGVPGAADEVGLTTQGLRDSHMGLAVLTTVILSTLGWLVLLAIIVMDYYGVFDGIAYSVFANSQLSSRVFVVVWHLAVVWFLAMNLTETRFRNFFRQPCPLEEATFVQIAQPKDQVTVMESRSRWLRELRHWEARLKRVLGHAVLITTAPVCRTASGCRYFEHQCTRYVYQTEPHLQCFQPFDLSVAATHTELHEQAGGITQAIAEARQDLIGPNFIYVPVPSFPRAVLNEFLAFFYLYQMMCLWVWYYFNYYYMGIEQTAVILLAALIKVVIRLRSERKIKSLAEYRSACRVLRDNVWTDLQTVDLVPGDVLAITVGMQIPCDGALLQGEVVVDESSLTGEAMPVRKFSVKADNLPYQKLGNSRTNTLFDGTRVLQIMGSEPHAAADRSAPEACLLVTATRTNTDKGRLVQRILYPATYSFIFDEHLKLVVLILLAWGGVCFLLIYWFLGNDISTWFYGVFTISFILSPLLPAMLVVGQSVAAGRLRARDIFCVDLPRIIIAGKVQAFCFDKTGTLTKEGLEFYGVQGVMASGDGTTPVFSARQETVAEVDPLWQIGLATSHTVTDVNGQLVGNPVDVELFRATGWRLLSTGASQTQREGYLDTLEGPTLDGRRTRVVQVVQRFEFVHARMSMSVAVRDPTTGHVHVFTKGSFEKIRGYARPASVPTNYGSVTAAWAKEGCYVLAMAHRDLGVADLATVRTMTREEMETDLEFMGLLLFKNQLKPDTADAIRELRDGDTRSLMITGDTALTGIYIARACEMVPLGAPVYLGDVDAKGGVAWTDVDTEQIVEDLDARLRAATPRRDGIPTGSGDEGTDENDDVKVLIKRTGGPMPELAVTGRAFDYLVAHDLIRTYLDHVRIFSRMTPDGKVACVQLHMERYITAMCGDGGNDCGALRAAHVGIALSEAEASIVSPFSTSRRTVQSCVELLRQGRTALATSFAGYKFLILYGETMAWLGLMQYYFSVIVPQPVWILIDGFITIPLCFSLTQALTRPRLAPRRPTARLLGPQTLASTIGQVLINLAFFIASIGLLYRQDWFRCHEFDASDVDAGQWWLLGDNYEAEIIGLTALYQFVNAAAAFNFGYYFRRAWWTNYLMVFLYAGFLTVVSLLTLLDPNRFSCLFRINCGSPDVLVGLGYPAPTWHIDDYNSPLGHNVLPQAYRWKLWGLCIGNCVTVLLYEYFVVLGPVGRYLRRRFGRAPKALNL